MPGWQMAEVTAISSAHMPANNEMIPMYTPQKTTDSSIIERVKQIDSWWNPYVIEGEPNILTKEWFREWHPWRLDVDKAVIDAAIGADKSGRTLLDIACNDGWYSFKAREAGFDVTGVEIRPEVVERAKLLQSYFGHDNIEFLEGDVQEDGTVQGPYDVSLFYGILYHLRDPIGALERVGQLTRKIHRGLADVA
jgi:2-polyprenyl-3-methyl-5-hydroxy-6-metoxy-1,4-benzoquinol methylase